MSSPRALYSSEICLVPLQKAVGHTRSVWFGWAGSTLSENQLQLSPRRYFEVAPPPYSEKKN